VVWEVGRGQGVFSSPGCWQAVPVGVSLKLPVVVVAVPDDVEPPVVFVFLTPPVPVSSAPVAVTFLVDVSVVPPVSSALFVYQHHRINISTQHYINITKYIIIT
jgi:hypothetical protein